MEQYYIVFDYDNSSIGINGDIDGAIPIYKDPLEIAGMSLTVIFILLSVAIGFLLAFISYVFMKCKYSRLQKELHEYDELNEVQE